MSPFLIFMLQVSMQNYPSPTPEFTTVFVFLVGYVLLIFIFFVLFCCVSLRSGFRIVMSVVVSVRNRCLVRLCLQLFVGGLMSYLCYLFLFAWGGVQHILCWVFVCFVFPSFCVPCVASFSGLSIFDSSFGIL